MHRVITVVRGREESTDEMPLDKIPRRLNVTSILNNNTAHNVTVNTSMMNKDKCIPVSLCPRVILSGSRKERPKEHNAIAIILS